MALKQDSPTSPWMVDSHIFDQPGVTLHKANASPVNISPPRHEFPQPDHASIRSSSIRQIRTDVETASQHSSNAPSTDAYTHLPIRRRPVSEQAQPNTAPSVHSFASTSSNPRLVAEVDEFGPELSFEPDAPEPTQSPGLHYHVFDDSPRKKSLVTHNRASSAAGQSIGSNSSGGDSSSKAQRQSLLNPTGHLVQRPPSVPLGVADVRGRNLSPFSHSPERGSPRSASSQRRSPSGLRPVSYVELLNNVPYSQQIAPGPMLNNSVLQGSVGAAASLLDTKKTLEMYRANVKKTNDASVQYEFAVFMVNAAKDAQPGDGIDPAELITEAKHILQRLADRTYPFAQYYLGDGYFSGLFNKDKPDQEKAFPLFASASKHGHAEAGYRAALCYEFGWGTTKSYPKAVQFYRAAASRNHPGAATRLGLACMRGDMGLVSRDHRYQREGFKWLKRAQESADQQYNSAPYELGLLHLTGYGDDIFKDQGYAAQLLTQAAELGHVQANYLMGQAYENGLYGCPRDAALSVHFYNGAASRGLPEAMMALCAWYMVGAAPVLEKDEAEACAWAKQAAELGLPKAEYAVGYFTEMGIGCRRDPLEANVWYVRAADNGNETAKQRLAIIRAASSGETGVPMNKALPKAPELSPQDGKEGKKKFMGIF